MPNQPQPLKVRDALAEALDGGYVAAQAALNIVADALAHSVEFTTDARKRTIVTGLAHSIRNGDLPTDATARYRLHISNVETGELTTELFQHWPTLEARVDELDRQGGFTHTAFSTYDGERVDL